MHVAIVPATPAHAVQLLPHVRAADHAEFAAFSGMTAAQVLDIGLRCSTRVYAGLVNNAVVVIFGVSPRSLLTGSGVPWLVASDLLPRYQKAFLRRCRPVVQAFLGLYPFLENYVDARNTVAIRWLRWLGFRLDAAMPTGIAGIPFRRFEMRRNQYVRSDCSTYCGDESGRTPGLRADTAGKTDAGCRQRQRTGATDRGP